jgi:hypothetical protein
MYYERTNPWIGGAFVLTLPNPGYSQSKTTEYHQLKDWFGH